MMVKHLITLKQIEKTKEEMKKFSVNDSENYENLLKASKSIFDVGFTKLADKPFNSFLFYVKASAFTIKIERVILQLLN